MPDSADKDRLSGKAKEAAGALTDNDRLRNEGKGEQASGKVKDAVNDTVDKVKDAFKK